MTALEMARNEKKQTRCPVCKSRVILYKNDCMLTGVCNVCKRKVIIKYK